jgi:hypothetical protein
MNRMIHHPLTRPYGRLWRALLRTVSTIFGGRTAVMSSQALEHGGNRGNKDLPGRIKAKVQALHRRAKAADLRLPLWVLGLTFGFWFAIFWADAPQIGSLSPVAALLKIYGAGIAVAATLAVVTAAVWTIVRRMGYAELLTPEDNSDN